MKSVYDLTLGFRDAENYKRKENKEFFNNAFLRTHSLDRICDQNIYFLIGEKGTGKTAYAVYLTNNFYNNTNARIKYIRETEYQKFLVLKREKHLVLSDYTTIWKVIIYLLIAEQISESEKSNPLFKTFSKFTNLKKAIDEYYLNAFSPEILQAVTFVEKSSLAAELLCKHAKASASDDTSVTFTETRFQSNLYYIQRQFEDALKSLKLSKNHLIFIDGIDIRPSSIQFSDYSECVKGLANAIWSINNDFFANIKDSLGRLRVVLLVRPDIFDSLGLQNQNSKVRDNSVLLDWRTTYTDYRYSDLFLMSDRLLSIQQDTRLEAGDAWDYYFPFNSSSVSSPQIKPSAFITFLRYSLYRPRDILTILSILKENLTEERRAKTSVFSINDFDSPSFTRKYSDYLLGEIKDHLSFYYTADAYENFVKFFQYLQGNSRFSYTDFNIAFSNYIDFLSKNNIKKPDFCDTPDRFLQFLYDLNIICYVIDTDDTPFFGYCFRERSPSNIAPKVKLGVRYDVHYGLMKSLDLGKKFSEIKRI